MTNKAQGEKWANNTVAVTGTGAYTPFGDWQAAWEALLNGRSGVGEITKFDASPYNSQIAAEIHLDARDLLGSKLAGKTSAFQKYALLAAREAARNARLVDEGGQLAGGIERDRVGVSLGVTFPSLVAIDEVLQKLDSPRSVRPNLIPMALQPVATSLIAQELGIAGGWARTNADACSAGTTAIANGMAAIRDRGCVDVVLAGGTDALVHPLVYAGFYRVNARMKLLAENACRPYDKDREGFPMGEGAVFLVLERLSHALDREAPILAILAGVGGAMSGYHETAPDPEGLGVRKAAEQALEMAKMSPDEIGLIVSHGVGTMGDVGEAKAIADLFGKKQPLVCSVVPNLGHMMGAAGALKAAVAVSALATGEIPPTLNHNELHPDCAAVNPYLRVCTKRTRFDGEAAMSWSAGLGDVQGCAVFRRWPGNLGALSR